MCGVAIGVGYAGSICDRQGVCVGWQLGWGMQGAYVIGRVCVWGGVYRERM